MLIRQMKDTKRVYISHRATTTPSTPINVRKWFAIVTLAVILLASMWLALEMVQINRALPGIYATVEARQNAELAAKYGQK